MAKRKTDLVVISVENGRFVVSDGIRKYEFTKEQLFDFKSAAHAAIKGAPSGSSRSFTIKDSNVYGLFYLKEEPNRMGFSIMFGNPSNELIGAVLSEQLTRILFALN